jgi:NAD(P)-dependent dehydrogenase (short-subunit alcohol dehydrogenase family)
VVASVPTTDLFRVDGSVAIVTGASSGLGVAFAKALAEAGVMVSMAGRRADLLDRTAREIKRNGGAVMTTRTDVTDPGQCSALVAGTIETFGKVDILVNNAGVGSGGPALKEDPDAFRRVIDVNVNGCFWMAQAFARRAERGGAIVNLGSVLGHTTAGLPHAAYAASKAAISGLTRDLAAQWTPRRGIRVNCLAPGFFPSEMTDQYPDGYLDRIARDRTLVLRLGRPEELAATLIWLVSPASGYVTGQTIVVDGGVTIT